MKIIFKVFELQERQLYNFNSLEYSWIFVRIEQSTHNNLEEAEIHIESYIGKEPNRQFVIDKVYTIDYYKK